MSAHNILGREGEDKAVIYLKSKDYEILECNWRYRRAEIDIICRKKNIIIFCEVKTRSSTFFGYPETSVSPAKQKLLLKAADEYLHENDLMNEVRFDVLSIYPNEKGVWKIAHFKDAFYPNPTDDLD